MAWRKINDAKLTAIADAIRGKTGKSGALTLDAMPTEIAGIETGGGSGKLPEGYTQLEYIESTGTQYINTGYKATSENYLIKCKFAITDYAANRVLFGGGASTDIISVLITSDAKLKFYVGSGSVSGLLVPFVTGTEYEMECHANNGAFTVTVNGTSYSGTYSGAINKDYPLFIFANNSAGSAGQFSSARIYEFQIYDNGTLVRDYTSCYNANDEIGLHDIANKVFYGNAGSGEFYSPYAPVLLWTNAAHGSSFAEQTITLPTGYDAYMIEYKAKSQEAAFGVAYCAFSNEPFANFCGISFSSNRTLSVGRKIGSCADGSISFEIGCYHVYNVINGTFNGSKGEDCAIPTRIWGSKFTL